MPKGVRRKLRRGEPHLEIYKHKSIFVYEDGRKQEYIEGKPNGAAIARLEKIRRSLDAGYLDSIVNACSNPETALQELNHEHKNVLDALVGSVTSEVGRALVGLTVLQLCVKSIAPDQSIRLHKGGRGDFSWVDGIPMRTLDKYFITPTLRKYGLLRLNSDGFMMTRSLAENYPYSELYKAAIRGAREEWLLIVDYVERGDLKPEAALRYLITLMINQSAAFKASCDQAIKAVEAISRKHITANGITEFLRKYVDTSSYRARVFEIALHSLFQALEDNDALNGYLKPLSQMRSANKKHGNVADIEVVKKPGSIEVHEAWDAKYGKSDLRDELEELDDKLEDHSETKIAGFVTDKKPDLRPEILKRIKEIEDAHGCVIQILVFEDWVKLQFERSGLDPAVVAQEWLTAFVESLCQKRREQAPIDEPSDAWVKELIEFAKNYRAKPAVN